MSTLFSHIDDLNDPIVRLDALLTILLNYTSHPLDDIDPEHTSFTLMMAMEQLDAIKAVHAQLHAVERGNRQAMQAGGANPKAVIRVA